MHYDPDKPVVAAEWLALDEMERHLIVEQFHKLARIRLPSIRVHAIMHAVIETQIAEGLTPVRGALDRMQNEGLSRHDAIHALGSVLVKHMFSIMKHEQPFDEKAYASDLDALSAKQWLAESEQED